MRLLKILLVNIVVTLLLAEAIGVAGLYFRHRSLFYAGLPPVSVGSQWVPHADRERLARDWGSNHPLLHPLFSAIGVPGPRLPEGAYDTAGWAKYLQTGNLYLPNRQDEAVVGVFGGSVAYDVALALAEPLSQLPAFKGRKITIALYAGAGYKQPQQLVQLAYFLAAGQQFDLVLNVDGYNDIKGGLTNMEKGVSYRVPNCDTQYLFDWILRTEAGVGQDRVRNARLVLESWQAHRLSRWANDTRSAAVRLGLELYLDYRAAEFQAEEIALRSELKLGGQLEYFGLPAGPEGDPVDNMPALVDHWARSSALMGQLCQRTGVPYLHVLQPNQYTGDKPLSDKERSSAVNDESNRRLIPAVYALLRQGLARVEDQGVPTFDATKIFEREPATLYYDSCCHMNTAGNDLFARAVADRVSRMAIPLPARPGQP